MAASAIGHAHGLCGGPRADDIMLRAWRRQAEPRDRHRKLVFKGFLLHVAHRRRLNISGQENGACGRGSGDVHIAFGLGVHASIRP